MKISEDMVHKQVNCIYDHLRKKFGEDYVFGVYAYFNKDDEIQYEGIVIPSFESICLNDPFILTIVDSVMVKDIRFIYNGRRLGHDELINGLYTDYRIISPKYEHIFNNLLLRHRDEIKKGMETGVPAEELKIAVMKILRFAWSDTSAAVRFCKQLTDAEKTALEGIINVVGDEGFFSQEKVCQATGISRLTLSRLVEKIKNCGVGEVEYHGVKGTWIHFIDDTVMNIRGI